jgi:hypothetical protein
MPKKGSKKKMRSKKESRVGQRSTWKKGSRGAYRAPGSVSVKTTNNNRAAVANNAGVNSKIGLSDDILRPLSKFAQDLNKKLAGNFSGKPKNLKKRFIEPCNGRFCFNSSNLDTFPGLNEANTSVNNGNDPADQARLCQYLSKLSQEVVYKNAKFMLKRSKLMFATMEKYFDKQERPVRASTRSAKRLYTATLRQMPSSSARSSTSTSSGPRSNSPPSSSSSQKPSSASSTSSNVRRGVNLISNFTFNSQSLVGNCNVDSKVEEIQTALNECSNVKIRKSILAKLLAKN